MTPHLTLSVIFYLTSVSVAFPGYFEHADEENEKSHVDSHYLDSHTKDVITTPSLPMELTEPTVDTARTIRQLSTGTSRRLRRFQFPRHGRADNHHDKIKEMLGGEFMDVLTVTETQLLDSDTEASHKNTQSRYYLTSATTGAPEKQTVADLEFTTDMKGEKYIFHEEKPFRQFVPITTSNTEQPEDDLTPTRSSTKLTKHFLHNRGMRLFRKPDPTVKIPTKQIFLTDPTINEINPVTDTASRFTNLPPEFSTTERFTSETHPAIARNPLTTFDVNIDEATVDDFISSTSSAKVNPFSPAPMLYYSTKTIPDSIYKNQDFTELPVDNIQRSNIVQRFTALGSESFHPLQVMANGTLMDWRKAAALRKGEYFDMAKFWRVEGKMTTKRYRKYIFVTKGNIYRVCVLADYKSLIVSCSIDNAMTICIKNLYVTNKIFQNEQGVRYNGSIVQCPTTASAKTTTPAGTESTKVCVNRRRTEFVIRCPPEGAGWTAQTRCVINYRRAPWRGPFDYMFGEAWVGTTVSCPQMSTTEQRYFYITMTCPTTSYPILDVEGLLALVANLTYDYEEDLVGKLNKSLYIYLSPPTIKSTKATTTLETTTPGSADYDEHDPGAIIAECYHCGMDETQIPYGSACHDAFSLDFMELLPVDTQAVTQLPIYRKYCRWEGDERNWSYNSSDTRSVFGRWTGGCSVRWIDLSGVYTERTCRNRQRPAMGKSFARDIALIDSRRMAKLELALTSTDSGCIASPMAVLVPLSRGISLYARFYACVCVGSFCNMAAAARAQWAWLLACAGLARVLAT